MNHVADAFASLASGLQVMDDDYSAPPMCETCDGAGWVIFEYKQNGVVIRREQAQCPNPQCPVVREITEQRWAKLHTQAQIPPKYEDLSFESWLQLFDATPECRTGKLDAYGAAMAFVEARENRFYFTLDDAAARVGLKPLDWDQSLRCGLVLSGVNGVGKTSLAVSIARALLNQGAAVLYIRLSEFFDALKERFENKTDYELLPGSTDEASLMTTVQCAPVLVIDEFYADVTKWRKERAEALINYRYSNNLPTVITTNLKRDELPMLWGMTTGQRIQSMCHWIQMGGEVIRDRAAEVVSR